MKIVKCSIANPLNDTEAKKAIIELTHKLPKTNSLPEVERYFDKQAQEVANALFEALPQGTFDRLIIALTSKRMSLYHGVCSNLGRRIYWMPASEALPVKDRLVLTTGTDGVLVGTYYATFRGLNGEEIYGVTHWAYVSDITP